MDTYAFDLEIFKNFFSAIFVNVDNEFDRETFIVFEDRNDFDRLRKFLNESKILCGFNNLHFDNVLLNAILEHYSLESLYILAQEIIKGLPSDLRWKKVSYQSIDFKEILGTDSSLKQITIGLEWDKVQDLPLPYDSTIEEEDVPLILSYNTNDVLPLVKLWNALQKEIALRKRVSELYKVDVSSSSEGQIPNVIFEKLYSIAVKKPIKEIKLGRTKRETVLLSDCLGKNIEFQSPTLRDFYERIKSLDVIKGFSEVVNFAGLKFNLGVGGIHTQDNPGKFYSTNDYLIVDSDVTSFYPNIILTNNIKPAHLSDNFLTILRNMTEDRIKAKAKGNKVDADILKIAINAAFGKLGNPDYWLYDPLAFYSVTISGQLYLLMLVEMLYQAHIEVISANTDGVISKVKDKSLFDLICKRWEQKTGFSLEFSIYEKYIRRDVNNYVAKSKDKTKRKGIFETRGDMTLYHRLMKSYRPDIIPQALSNYFLDAIPVQETVRGSKNIFDFMMSQRVGKVFKTVFRNGTDEILQRTNRWYASTEGGQLLKVDDTREISILAGTLVQVANEISDRAFESYKVNFRFYEDEVMKIVEQIEPSVEQIELF